MSKLLNVYSDNIDRTWYKSSNILYSECIDNDNKPKTLKVVFSMVDSINIMMLM